MCLIGKILSAAQEYDVKVVLLIGADKRKDFEFKARVSKATKCNACFTVIASNKPNKSEIIFMIPIKHGQKPCALAHSQLVFEQTQV